LGDFVSLSFLVREYKKLIAINLLLIMVVGCGPVTPVVQDSPITLPSTPTQEIEPATPAFTPSPTQAPTVMPTSDIPLLAPPTGLLYQDNIGLWQIDPQQKPQLVISLGRGDYAYISPDGKRVLYLSGEPPYFQYSVIDLTTQQKKTLDPGVGYIFCHVDWWKNRPDMLVALVEPIELSGGMACRAVPGIVDANSGKTKLIGDKPSWYSLFDPSPDGKTLAFGQDGEPWLYSLEQGSRKFPMEQYGFPTVKEAFVSTPAWSPGGRYLAWLIHGKINGEDQQGVGVFDMRQKTSIFYHPYQVEDVDGARGWILWDASEKSFILQNSMAADEFQRIFLDGHSVAVKFFSHSSPDGSKFAYFVYDKNLRKAFVVVSNVATSESHMGNIPLTQSAQDWFERKDVNWPEDAQYKYVQDFYTSFWSSDSTYLSLSNDEQKFILNTMDFVLYRLDLAPEAKLNGFTK
jgi:Tol biopolymer transport system component